MTHTKTRQCDGVRVLQKTQHLAHTLPCTPGFQGTMNADKRRTIVRKALIFFVDTQYNTADSLAEDYPLLQTKALLATLGEIELWARQARICLGPEVPCLTAHREWLDMVENHVEDMLDALDEDNKELETCQLDADDPLIEALETVLDCCPEDDEIRDELRNKSVAEPLVSLSAFWINQLQHLLKRLLGQVTGSGEVLATIKRQETLDSLSS